MNTRPLHPEFGVELLDADLGALVAGEGFDELRALFEQHSLLLVAGRPMTDAEHAALAARFGPLENRAPENAFRMSPVTNVRADGAVAAEGDRQVLNLKANQLWHTDSTFLPVPALANLLQARVVSTSGGETEFVSTRAGFARLEPALQERLRATVFRHDYTHSRRRIDPGLATEHLFTRWTPQRWRAVWTNPVTGVEAVYVASHVNGADGLPDDEAQALAGALVERMTAPAHVYTHRWRVGDLLIWDERATLHRGRPWPYEQPRTLASICVSVTADDGLESMRPLAA